MAPKGGARGKCALARRRGDLRDSAQDIGRSARLLLLDVAVAHQDILWVCVRVRKLGVGILLCVLVLGILLCVLVLGILLCVWQVGGGSDLINAVQDIVVTDMRQNDVSHPNRACKRRHRDAISATLDERPHTRPARRERNRFALSEQRLQRRKKDIIGNGPSHTNASFQLQR